MDQVQNWPFQAETGAQYGANNNLMNEGLEVNLSYLENKSSLDSNSSSCESSGFAEENRAVYNSGYDEAYHFMSSTGNYRQMGGFQDCGDFAMPFSYAQN